MSLFDNIFKITTKWIIKHSVELAMGGAAIGVGLTVYTTTKSTLKVAKIVHNEELTKKEKVKQSIVPCLPTAASVIFTLTAIGGMYWLGRKKQAALFALLMSTTNAFQQYRNKVRDEKGMKEESKIYADSIAKAKKLDDKRPDIPKTDNELVFCDSVTGQYFTSTEAKVYQAMYLANREFILRGELEFNSWLEYLGCDEDDILFGFGWEQTQGWEFFGYQFIDFVLVPREDKNGKQYRLITYPFLPHALYPDEMGRDADDCLMLNPSVDTDMWKKMSAEEKEEILQSQVVEVLHE